MKYVMTFRQSMRDDKPLILAKTVDTTEQLKFYLDAMENCPCMFKLISVVPGEED